MNPWTTKKNITCSTEMKKNQKISEDRLNRIGFRATALQVEREARKHEEKRRGRTNNRKKFWPTISFVKVNAGRGAGEPNGRGILERRRLGVKRRNLKKKFGVASSQVTRLSARCTVFIAEAIQIKVVSILSHSGGTSRIEGRVQFAAGRVARMLLVGDC